jgi:hypothetical protein
MRNEIALQQNHFREAHPSRAQRLCLPSDHPANLSAARFSPMLRPGRPHARQRRRMTAANSQVEKKLLTRLVLDIIVSASVD